MIWTCQSGRQRWLVTSSKEINYLCDAVSDNVS